MCVEAFPKTIHVHRTMVAALDHGRGHATHRPHMKAYYILSCKKRQAEPTGSLVDMDIASSYFAEFLLALCPTGTEQLLQ